MTSEPLTILTIKKKYLSEIDSPDLDFIIGFVIKKNREFILTHPELKICSDDFKKIETLVNRRRQNEPLAYIFGNKEFYGLNFLVNQSTLIPRPETELLVDLALEQIVREKTVTNVIDLGTGSGNIIISIVANLKKIKLPTKNRISFFASDISKKAINLAKKNSLLNNISDIKFINGDLLNPFRQSKRTNQQESLIILANLPYLSKEIYKKCPPDVKDYEPQSALFSPQNGLGHYIKLFKQLKSLKAKKIIIFLEISPEQKKLLAPIIKNFFPLAKYEFKKDLAKKWRVAIIKINSKN